METKLTQYTSLKGERLRTIREGENIYFVGKDAAQMLGYANTKDAISKHCKGVAKHYPLSTPGGTQTVRLISEPDFYRLVVNSKLPTAQEYEKWVFEEVLPDIRRSGAYVATTGQETSEELIARALIAANDAIARQKARLERLEAENNEQAQELAAMDVTLAQQKLALDEAAPKAIFADAVAQSDNCILIGELAKLIRQNGIAMGQTRMFRWLRDNGYLHRNSTRPTQRSMEKGLFRVIERTVVDANGCTRLCLTTKVTGKGQQYFINLFLKNA